MLCDVRKGTFILILICSAIFKGCRKITDFLVQCIPQMFVVNVAVQIENILWLSSVLEAKAGIVPQCLSTLFAVLCYPGVRCYIL